MTRAQYTEDVAEKPYVVAARLGSIEVKRGRRKCTETVTVYCAWRDLGDAIHMSHPSRWGAADAVRMLNGGYCPMSPAMMTLTGDVADRERARWTAAAGH